MLDRRGFIAGAAMLTAAPFHALVAAEGAASLYGLIGKLTAVSGRRDELLAILLEGTGAMPGCLSYVIGTDPAEPDAIWISEVWETKAAHAASLNLPAVRDAIRRGRPLFAGMTRIAEYVPVGGHGLAPGA